MKTQKRESPMDLITVCKSKIQNATITQANLFYEGSITIDEEYMKMAEIVPYEQVHVLNVNNGMRIITYAIVGEKGKREFCLNGAAARAGAVGDKIIIISYKHCDAHSSKVISGMYKPTILLMNDDNEVKEVLGNKLNDTFN
jgi:aspartate 1-decarboxylase